MKNSLTNYVLKVYLSTFVMGLIVGGTVLYIKDIRGGSYNNAWDNPFMDFILFFLVGIGESVIPLFVFIGLANLLGRLNLKNRQYQIYFFGLICTVAPFVQLYYMVNEGYHRTNVVIYAVCFVCSLIISFRVYNSNLIKAFAN